MMSIWHFDVTGDLTFNAFVISNLQDTLNVFRASSAWAGTFYKLTSGLVNIGTGDFSRMFTSRPIGFVSSPYKDASEVPKGLGAKHEADGVLKILPEFEPGLADIEGFSHLIVIWEFDRSPKLELHGPEFQGDELIATPPSDNRPHGVFATRSPRRPNPIGLTTVELRCREGTELHVRGVDMLDGTPILDIKPYLSSIPIEKLHRGWLAEAEARQK